MKQVPIILSLLATAVMGSYPTNSADEVVLGESSPKPSEFRESFYQVNQPLMTQEVPKMLPHHPSGPSSPSVGRSEFYNEVLKVGTRDNYVQNLSLQDAYQQERNRAQEEEDIARALEESSLDARIKEALTLSERLIPENLKMQEIAKLEDQIETLESFVASQRKEQKILHNSLIATISKMYSFEDEDTKESRTAATIQHEVIDKELNASRDQNELIWKELSGLRDKVRELKYPNQLMYLADASSDQPSSGIGGPSGFGASSLPTIHSSALVTSSILPTQNISEDK